MKKAFVHRELKKKELIKSFEILGKISEFFFHANRNDLSYYETMDQKKLIYEMFGIREVKSITLRINSLSVEIIQGYSWEPLTQQIQNIVNKYAY